MRRHAHRRAAIAHHYDLSHDFYACFLDPLLVYTCAYYRSPEASLEQAQRDKLDLVCQKLRIRRDDYLLDVGCGWGGLAVWAAQHYGARVLGVTLSAAQAAYVEDRVRREGLADRVRVQRRDCLDLAGEGPFDRIAAVGVIEHLGVAAYGRYFGLLRDLLRPGGLLLNHGITQARGLRHSSQWDFLIAHVFPGGELAHVSRVTDAIEGAGLEILDVEGLRLHYARTCRQWTERLQAAAPRAVAAAGPRTYRTWLLYLAAASVAFEQAWINVYQVLAARPDRAAGPVPRTREHLVVPPG
jgi:cyclopropane-fatty-acyl-phospholipid synthase